MERPPWLDRKTPPLFCAAAATLTKAQPHAIIQVSLFNTTAAFIRKARKAGYVGSFLNFSVVGIDPLFTALGKEIGGVVVSQVVPHPKVRTLKVIREFQNHLQEYDPKAVSSFNNLEGYIAARTLVEGLRRTGRDLTREKFVKAMESMDADLGDYRIAFTPANHNGSDFVQITMIIGSEGGFTY